MSHAQVIIMTVATIVKSSQPADKKLMANIQGEWMFQEAEIDKKDVMGDFGKIKIYFPKCKKADKKAGKCQSVYVHNDDQTDYFKLLLKDENTIAVTSRKDLNKAAKISDAEYQKVKYEMVTAGGSDYEFSMKFKKGTLRIETIGNDDHSEYFLLVRPPKVKKKKS
jgi:hypothetical protein